MSEANESTHPIAQTSQDTYFHKRLLMEPFLVANDLHSNNTAILVIHTSHNLSERSFAQYIDDLVPIGEVVAKHDIIVASLVIIAEVARLVLVGA